MRPLFILFILLLASYSYAEKKAEQFLVVPQCLLEKNIPYEALAEADELSFIKTSQLKRLQVASSTKPRRCRGFMNVTAAWLVYSKKPNSDADLFLKRYLPRMDPSDLLRGYRLQYSRQVNLLFQNIKPDNVKQDLAQLVAFPDRQVNSESGVEAAAWIKQQVQAMVATASHQEADIYEIPTPNAKQASIVLRIGRHLTMPAVVIGTPMDTLVASSRHKQPGADDSASGVVTTLEAARILLSSELVFKKPIYFIWYAGEEEGKLGSQRVVEYFNQHNVQVDAVLQLDMTGYVSKRNPGIGLIDDLTDGGLTAFVADLIAAYVKLPAGAVRCGYACSDQASWYLNNNRVAYPFEVMDDKGNPYVHTRRDTVDKLDINHMVNFVKLTLAFAVELAL